MKSKYVNHQFNPRLRFWLRFAGETWGTQQLAPLAEVRLRSEQLAVNGLEHLPTGNFVLAVNHFSGRATFDAAAAVLRAVSQTRPDVVERLLFVVGKRERTPKKHKSPLAHLVNWVYGRWSGHMVSVPLYNTNASLAGLREWRQRDQPVFVFPEGKARVEFGRIRVGSGRWLSWLNLPVIPVGVWWEHDSGWHVNLGRPISWSPRAELRDLQLGLAMAALLPADLAPAWQIDLERWRSAHAKVISPLGGKLMSDNDPVPEYLQNIYDLLKCAFPAGISNEDYRPVLSLLHEVMSFWTIADVLSALTSKDRSEVYNDASGFELDPLPSSEDIERVRVNLDSCGFAGWFKLTQAMIK